MKFTVVRGNDWEAIYLGEYLLTQNSRISAIDLLRCMEDYRVEAGRLEVSVREADLDWLETLGTFPEELCDVKCV